MRAREVPALRDRLLSDVQQGRWKGMKTTASGQLDAQVHAPGDIDPRGATLDAGFSASKEDLDNWLRAWADGSMAPSLRASELFYVNAAMIRLADQAAAAKPDYTLRREDLPAQCGILVWEIPQLAILPVPDDIDYDHEGFRCIGVVWRDTGTGVQLANLVDLLPWVQRNRGADTADYWLQQRPQYLPLVADEIEYGQQVFFPAAYDDTGHDIRHVEMLMRLRSLLMVTWLLMGQEIVMTQRYQPRSKAAIRRARRQPLPSVVRIVTLRHVHQDPAEIQAQLEGKGRHYYHRWYVRGHWRNQYYPSSGEHRPIWIASFIKGPDGAPLLTGTIVRVLSR